MAALAAGKLYVSDYSAGFFFDIDCVQVCNDVSSPADQYYFSEKEVPPIAENEISEIILYHANEKNLITGTHYFNVTGMLPFENMEAWSVEDDGEGVCFNVYVFNVQQGSTINYKTGAVTSTTKSAQTITDGTYTKKVQSFKIACSTPGKLTYSKSSVSSIRQRQKNSYMRSQISCRQ